MPVSKRVRSLGRALAACAVAGLGGLVLRTWVLRHPDVLFPYQAQVAQLRMCSDQAFPPELGQDLHLLEKKHLSIQQLLEHPPDAAEVERQL